MNKITLAWCLIGLVLIGCASVKPKEIGQKDLIIENNVLVKYTGSARAIIIPDNLGITRIGREAFEKSKIVSVVIPKGVTTIDRNAFYYCEKLTNVELPDTLKTIGYSAFDRCTIPRLKLPASVTSIDEILYWDVGNWEVDEANTYYAALDGVLFDKNITRLIYYSQHKTEQSYTVPKTVTTIGKYAFKWAKSLKQIILPENLKEIEHDAFWGSGITSISIPSTVTSMRSNAFNECRSLIRLTFPEGSITAVSRGAFLNCISLQEVYLPKSVETIESKAFQACYELMAIHLYENTFIHESAIVDAYGDNLTHLFRNKGVFKIRQ